MIELAIGFGIVGVGIYMVLNKEENQSDSTSLVVSNNQALTANENKIEYPLDLKHKITGRYGAQSFGRTPKRRFRFHKGVDISCPVYSKVYAIDDGIVREVVYTGYYPSDPRYYGNKVVIEHSDNRFSLYSHLKVSRVQVGDTVKRGQHIADSGGEKKTKGAGNTAGPHLHFEYRIGGNSRKYSVDPELFLEKNPGYAKWYRPRFAEVSSWKEFEIHLKNRGIELDGRYEKKKKKK